LRGRASRRRLGGGSRSRCWPAKAGIEEYEVAPALAGRRGLRFMRGNPRPLSRPPRPTRVARLQLLAQLVQLLAGLLAARRRAEELYQHASNVWASGKLVGKRLHRAECFIQLALGVHPLQVLEEISLGFDHHVLASVQPGQMEVGLGATWIHPE